MKLLKFGAMLLACMCTLTACDGGEKPSEPTKEVTTAPELVSIESLLNTNKDDVKAYLTTWATKAGYNLANTHISIDYSGNYITNIYFRGFDLANEKSCTLTTQTVADEIDSNEILNKVYPEIISGSSFSTTDSYVNSAYKVVAEAVAAKKNINNDDILNMLIRVNPRTGLVGVIINTKLQRLEYRVQGEANQDPSDVAGAITAGTLNVEDKKTATYGTYFIA